MLIPLATPGDAAAMLAIALAGASFGGVVYNIGQVTLRRSITAQHRLGRMNATIRFLVWGPVGFRDMNDPARGSLHHVELWVPELAPAIRQWGWLLGQLGYAPFQDWPDGRSWRLGITYLVIEQSPALSASDHDRLRPGMNHLAFHAGTRQQVDDLAAEGPAHGWTLLFPGTHPYAGGSDHYAAYLANTDGFEVELVATVT